MNKYTKTDKSPYPFGTYILKWKAGNKEEIYVVYEIIICTKDKTKSRRRQGGCVCVATSLDGVAKEGLRR